MEVSPNVRDLKLKILKASRAIRKKHMRLRQGRVEADELLQKTFKPISEPLKELGSTLKEEVRFLKEPQINNEETLPQMTTHLDSFPSPTQFNLLTQTQSSPSPQQILTPTSPHVRTLPPKSYILRLFRDTSSRALDTTFGPIVDPHTSSFKIGNSVIIFSGNDMVINDKVYKGTEGLYELLFKREPYTYTAQDEDSYRDILQRTHVLHRDFNPEQQLRGSKSYKYNNIIKPLLERTSGKGHMIASDAPYQYIYWNDVNELVDRLRLLKASQEGGNASHNNEIMSIIEELREAGVVQ